MAAAERVMSAIMIVKYSSLIYLTLCQYFRMELLHCEKLRKQKKELEKAEMDLVSVSQIEHEQREMQKKSTHTQKLSFFYSVPEYLPLAPSRVNMNFLQRS